MKQHSLTNFCWKYYNGNWDIEYGMDLAITYFIGHAADTMHLRFILIGSEISLKKIRFRLTNLISEWVIFIRWGISVLYMIKVLTVEWQGRGAGIHPTKMSQNINYRHEMKVSKYLSHSFSKGITSFLFSSQWATHIHAVWDETNLWVPLFLIVILALFNHKI